MMNTYISFFSQSTYGIFFFVIKDCVATSNITSSDIVKYLAVILAKTIIKSLRVIDIQIIALKPRKFDFILIADFILLTQDSKDVFL